MRKWIAVSSLLLVAALAAGYWGYRQHNDKQVLQTALNNNYQRAFYSLADHVQNMEVLLGKSLVATGPGSNEELFEDIWQRSNRALDNLTQLPVSDALLGRTAKFITQLGDYARMLAEQTAGGRPVTPEQWNTLNRLYEQASVLNRELGKIHSEVADGSYNFYELAASGQRRLGRQGRELAGAGFQTIDKEMQGYPTLIYDGPFSDHLERGKARGVTGDKISTSRARSVALRYYDRKGAQNVIAQVTGEVEGNIPAYRVEIVQRRGGTVVGDPTVADVSKQGGHLIWMLTPRRVTSTRLDLEQGRSRAEDYLKKHGYDNMRLSYHQRNDNTVTFNYVLMQNGVIIYPDLIKVTVALDNGQVVGMDARGYLMSHRQRRLPEPKLTEQEARALVSDRLSLQGQGRLVLIPLEVDKEKLTWEFKGEMRGDTYLVYINALDGKEEKVLRLINSGNGTLTM